jgi:hypothetical protein
MSSNLRSINVAVTNAEGEPDTLEKAVNISPKNDAKRLTRTTMAETSQMIAERKLKASAAFQRPHVACLLKCQDQMLPQGSFLIVSTRTPKAANQAREIRISTGDRLVLLRVKAASLGTYKAKKRIPTRMELAISGLGVSIGQRSLRYRSTVTGATSQHRRCCG